MNNLESLKSYFSSELILVIGIVALVFLSLRKSENNTNVSLVFTSIVLVLALFATIQTHFTTSL